jgi:hypothetical protein
MKISIRNVFSLAAAASLVSIGLACAGCGGPAYEYDSVVSGTVTIDGELAPSGTITFHPVATEGRIAIGRIYPDGSFSLRTGQGDLRESDGGTVVPGEYIVTVVVTGSPPTASQEGVPPSSGPLLIDKRYISRDTSDLRCTVKPGQNVVELQLDRAQPVEIESETAEEAVDGTPPADDSASESASDRADDAGGAKPAEPAATTAPAEGATP